MITYSSHEFSDTEMGITVYNESDGYRVISIEQQDGMVYLRFASEEQLEKFIKTLSTVYGGKYETNH